MVLIDGVEYLNKSSANSLLKFLEEPSGNTIIFIITQDESKLLPTVRSRCSWWKFNPVMEKDIILGLKEKGIDGILAEEVAKFSWGRPGRAIDLALDVKKFDKIRL